MCFDFSQLTHLDVLVAGGGSDATCCESMLRRHEAMRRFAPHHSCYATQLCGLCYHTRPHYGKAEQGHHRPDTLFGHSPHDDATGARWHLDGQTLLIPSGKLNDFIHPGTNFWTCHHITQYRNVSHSAIWDRWVNTSTNLSLKRVGGVKPALANVSTKSPTKFRSTLTLLICRPETGCLACEGAAQTYYFL